MALLLPPLAFGAEPLSFERDVRPIFKAYCLDCHGGGEKLEGNLDLRLKRFLVKGGDSGAAVAPGNAAGSLIVERMKSGEMPPTEKKVPADKIAVLERWIAAGAPTLRDEPEQLPPGIDITPEERAFWSFQPLQRPEPPSLERTVGTASQLAAQPNADLVRTPVDAFLLARLREKGLRFSPPAEPRTLIRRVALDLTGLPPTQAELDRFLGESDEQAYERMVDYYLASPHYGERWGRHWLDVAGYADSEGNGNEDTPRPYAYKYRDYVIRALNADKPLNQFLVEQLAGDELVPQPWNNLTPEQIETLAATGFLRMVADPTASGGTDAVVGGNQVVTDALKIVGSSLLGLTVGCAQCHDHRYDPIPQVDYFRLRAIFEPAIDPAHWRRPGQRLVSLYKDADRAKAAEVEAEVQKMQAEYNAKQAKFVLAAFEKELLKFPEEQREALRAAYTTAADKRTQEQKQLLLSNPKVNISPGVLYQYDVEADKELKADQAKIAAKRAEKPIEDFVSVLNETPGVIPETKVHHRGDYRDPRAAVTPGDLTIAAPDGKRFEIAPKDPQLPTTGRRLAYAKYLTSGAHPLVGRVLANRIWLHHFGRGLVESPGEFGFLGTPPTHPELLDWLATELPRLGWSLKQFHKVILLSHAYRQSSRRTPAAADQDGALYSRYPLRRLDAEALRDRMLVASGTLDRAQFGPPVSIEEDFVGQVVVKDEKPRRSIYLQQRRTKPLSFLTTFDAPVMAVNCERRVPSTGAPQSLMLMNSDFVLKQAELFAQRLRKETPGDYAPELTASLATKFPRHAEAWQFGWGAYDEPTKRVAQFAPLPHFTGSAWQGGSTLPDPQLGWVLLLATGGHSGNDPQHAAIRRWVAPLGGKLSISGKLKHASEAGDGVRGRIVSSRVGLLGECTAHHGEATCDVAAFEVQPGDTIDFVLDCRESVTSDSFEWTAELKLSDDQGAALGVWNSARDFHGPLGTSLPQQIAYAWQVAYQRQPTRDELVSACQFVAAQAAELQRGASKTEPDLGALTSLCQQLLSSNEFLYGD
jgi:hypothetical protein